MRTRLTALGLFLVIATPGRSFAKPRPGASACEFLLSTVREKILEQNLYSLFSHEGRLAFLIFKPRELRTRKLGMIHKRLREAHVKGAVFSSEDIRDVDPAVIRNDADAIRVNKRGARDHLVNAPVLIVNSVEDFIFAFEIAERAENAALLREILRERIDAGRPSILTLDEVNTPEDHLIGI